MEIGKAEIVRNFENTRGAKVALFGLGNLLPFARQAADQLKADGFDVAVVNPRFVKPLDTGVTSFLAQAADLVVTLEDHVITGGYGTAVMEHLGEAGIATPVLRIGWPDQFIEHASSVDELRTKYGLTVETTVTRIKERLQHSAGASKRLSAVV
jgi:1-deoxy-D-xylulose-5-phosphate synthase